MTAWEDPKAQFPESYQETTVFTAATVYEDAIGLYSRPQAHTDPTQTAIIFAEFSYFPTAELFTSSCSFFSRFLRIMPLKYYREFSYDCRVKQALRIKSSIDETVDHSVIELLSTISCSGCKPQLTIETTCGRTHSLETHMIYFFDSGRIRFIFSTIASNKTLFFAPLFAKDVVKPWLSELPCRNTHSLSELAQTGFLNIRTENIPVSWITPELSPDLRTLTFSVQDPNTITTSIESISFEVNTITAGFSE